jgi:hypothetical protein
MIKQIRLLVLLWGAALSTAQAQLAELPVQWSWEIEELPEGETALVFTATIQSGWYLYSQHIEEGGPIPTAVVFEPSAGVELIGATEESGDKLEGMDAVFGMHVAKFKGEAQFRQRLKLTPGQHELSGYVEFMTCDDEMCLPPTQWEFSLVLR